jgi:CheY-like chemotaxis protein
MKTHDPVLIVEDDADVRHLLAERVRNEGYRTVDGASGEEALELVRQQPPSLVLLDLLLPGINGWEVLHQLAGDNGEAKP